MNMHLTIVDSTIMYNQTISDYSQRMKYVACFLGFLRRDRQFTYMIDLLIEVEMAVD